MKYKLDELDEYNQQLEKKLSNIFSSISDSINKYLYFELKKQQRRVSFVGYCTFTMWIVVKEEKERRIISTRTKYELVRNIFQNTPVSGKKPKPKKSGAHCGFKEGSTTKRNVHTSHQYLCSASTSRAVKGNDCEGPSIPSISVTTGERDCLSQET